MNNPATPRLLWDDGTAYDFFISLRVLHHADDFGLRGSWAAGVRSRLPVKERKFLEVAESVVSIPLHWIESLPEPKDTAAALAALAAIPAAERLPRLGLNPEMPAEAGQVLRDVASRQTWEDADLEALRRAYQVRRTPPRPKVLETWLASWAEAAEFGEKYLEGLRVYQQVFFAEEEERIRPALKDGLAQAQELAQRLALPALLEDLSQGVHFTAFLELDELRLAPSYWSTPLVVYSHTGASRVVLIFGVRPPDASLVPGEVVPDALLRALKALADPTRLRILRYLSAQPLTPAQLARRLRLRAPTVIHHLSALRLAGLVHLTIASGGERYYAARTEAVSAAMASLQAFLK
jgi:DNA-binding transcriptional ArsR family regulator